VAFKKIGLVVLLMLLAAPLAMGVTLRKEPVSLTESDFAEGGLGYDITKQDPGFAPTTGVVALISDDSYADWYDSTLAWNERGIYLGFGIVRKWNADVDPVTYANRFTDAQIQTLAANGNEMLNHSRTHRYQCALSDAELESEINDAYYWMTDTLGVECWGGDYPGGQWNDEAWIKWAENHFYATGGYGVQRNVYEDTADIAVDIDGASGPYIWRYTGSPLAYADSIMWANSADSVYYGTGLIYGWDIPNPYHVPVGMVLYNTCTASNHACSLLRAKAMIKLAERNNAACLIFCHAKTDIAWIDSLVWFIEDEIDAGRLQMKLPKDIVNDYLFRPVKSGANLFPGGGRRKSTHRANLADRPDGWQEGIYQLGNDPVWIRRDAATGFKGNPGPSYDWRTSSAYQRLSFTRVIPPGEYYLYCSMKIRAYGSFQVDDSIEVASWIDTYDTRYDATTQGVRVLDGNNGPYTYVWRTPGGGLANQSREISGRPNYNTETDANWDEGNYPYYVRTVANQEDYWKEIHHWRTVRGPLIIGWRVANKNTPTQAWSANRGLEVDDVIFSLIRRDRF